MNQTHPQDRDVDRLLADIAHVNQVSKEEIERVGKQLARTLEAAQLSRDVRRSLEREIAAELGRLSARVRLADAALRSMRPSGAPAQKSHPASPAVDAAAGAASIFSARDLDGNPNLLPLESSPEGLEFCWTGARAETVFRFPVDRSRKQEMCVRLLALIKPEYAKQMMLLVNGQRIPHQFYRDGALYVVSCPLPAVPESGETEVQLILPATHSPAELGGGPDERQLGVAISEIRFGKPQSALLRLLRRLRLKN